MEYVVVSDFEKESIVRMLKNCPSKTSRNRCMCILLSAQRIPMTQIAIEVGVSWHTVFRLVKKWNTYSGYKLRLLEIAKDRGAKYKLTEFPMEGIIKKLLKTHNHNIKSVLIDLDIIYNTKVCEKTLRRFIYYYNL